MHSCVDFLGSRVTKSHTGAGTVHYTKMLKVIKGTPGYIAPEKASGQGNFDVSNCQNADLYRYIPSTTFS